MFPGLKKFTNNDSKVKLATNFTYLICQQNAEQLSSLAALVRLHFVSMNSFGPSQKLAQILNP